MRCPNMYPPSADAPHDGPGWSGPLQCVLSDGHLGDRHWNNGINWASSQRDASYASVTETDENAPGGQS